MKNRKYDKEEMRKIVDKHKRINAKKKEENITERYVINIIEVCEEFLQLNKYK